MNEPPVQPFDDPALKAALSRALGREAAPEALRRRVGEMAATDGAGGGARGAAGYGPDGGADAKPIPLRRRGPLFRFAAAAVIVGGFASLSYQAWDYYQTQQAYNPSKAFSASLYQAMLDAHLSRAGGGPAGDSVATLDAAAGLGARVGRPVWVADLTKDGWTFAGGGVRKVGADESAQLFFTNGKAAISVFSMPASAAPGARDGQTYDASFKNAAIAGFTRGKGLYCIVGTGEDGAASVARVKAMLEAHRGELRG